MLCAACPSCSRPFSMMCSLFSFFFLSSVVCASVLGRTRGRAFVVVVVFCGLGFWRRSVAEFSNKDDMTRAVRELDDTYFADRRIRVDYVSTFLFSCATSLTFGRLGT